MPKKLLAAAAALVALLAVLAVAGCGGNDQTTSTSQAESTDGAFITAMIPHHESAIEMAKIAQKQAQHPEIAKLADDIVSAQDAEISDMNTMHQRMFGEPVDGADHGSLGLDENMMGMSMDMSSLENSKQFDKAFIDAMIPHHQGAIRMARIEIAQGQDQQTKDLAQAIIDAQSREIDEMNQWREQWYGSPSPAGGVPMMDESTMPTHDEMGH